MDGAPRQNDPMWEYKGIQALRAVAAFAVVFGHSINFVWREHGVLPSAVEEFQGAVGVDLFFVISGFVMMISSPRLLRRPHPTRIFLWRRVLRVVPLYWLLTTVKLLTLVVFPSASIHGLPSMGNAVASFLFLPSRNPSGEIRPVIPLGWTLNFEMLFYVLFACTLAHRDGLRRILVPALCALAVVGVLRPANWPAWTSLADPIVLEFAAGVGIARLVQTGRLPSALWGGGSILLGVASLLVLKPGVRLLTERVLWWGIPAALIVLGVVALEPAIRGRLPRWLLLLGSASYAVYLVQTFVFPAVDQAATLLRGAYPQVTPLGRGFGFVTISLALTALFGVGTHLLLEKPMTTVLKRTFGPDRIAPIARQS